jgi:hypothetical protein
LEARFVYAYSLEQGSYMNDDTQTTDQTGGSGDTPIVNTDGKTDQSDPTPPPASNQ